MSFVKLSSMQQSHKTLSFVHNKDICYYKLESNIDSDCFGYFGPKEFEVENRYPSLRSTIFYRSDAKIVQ